MISFDVTYDIICEQGAEHLADINNLCYVIKNILVKSWDAKGQPDIYKCFDKAYQLRLKGNLTKDELLDLIDVERLKLLSKDTIIHYYNSDEDDTKTAASNNQQPGLLFVGEIGASYLVLYATPKFSNIKKEVSLYNWNRIKRAFINWLESEVKAEQIHYKPVDDTSTNSKIKYCEKCRLNTSDCECICDKCKYYIPDCKCASATKTVPVHTICDNCYMWEDDCICNDPVKAEEFGLCFQCKEFFDTCVCVCPDCKQDSKGCKCVKDDKELLSKEDYERYGICYLCDEELKDCCCQPVND